jgi:hypothetical protein
VAGCVDEIQHAQHDGELAGLVQAAPLQGSLGPADPLRHRGLRHVEGVGDLPVRTTSIESLDRTWRAQFMYLRRPSALSSPDAALAGRASEGKGRFPRGQAMSEIGSEVWQ